MLCIGYAEGQSGGGGHDGSRARGAVRASLARLDHPGLRFRTMRSLSSDRPKAGPVGIASARIADAEHRRSV
jgi:hypothetical protein